MLKFDLNQTLENFPLIDEATSRQVRFYFAENKQNSTFHPHSITLNCKIFSVVK